MVAAMLVAAGGARAGRHRARAAGNVAPGQDHLHSTFEVHDDFALGDVGRSHRINEQHSLACIRFKRPLTQLQRSGEVHDLKATLAPRFAAGRSDGNRMGLVGRTENHFLGLACTAIGPEFRSRTPEDASDEERAAPAELASPSGSQEGCGFRRRTSLQVAGFLKSISITSNSARRPSGRKMLAEYRNRADRSQAENSWAPRVTASRCWHAYRPAEYGNSDCRHAKCSHAKCSHARLER